MTICAICQSDETEGGDDLCGLCRQRLGEDRDRIDRAIVHQAQTRSLRLTRDGLIRALTTTREAAE